VDFLESVAGGFDERTRSNEKKTDDKMRAKRRRLEAGFKAKVGLEALKGIKMVAQIAREYQVHPNQVSQWKSEVSRRLPEVFENGPSVQIQESEQEIERLERKVGQLTKELDWLKKKSRQLGL
jgi:transposase